MIKMKNTNEKLTIEQINQFQEEHNVKFTEKYIQFLLMYNGGNVNPNIFAIPDDDNEGVLNVFLGIGDMSYNLHDDLESYDLRLPKGFIPIACDPGGNVICLGTDEKYYDKIYFWDHENEQQDVGMGNMYFLANDIFEFLDSLYEDEEEENFE